MHVLERSQRLAASRPGVFAFFSDPRNLARITPAGLNFRVVDAPDALAEGSRLEYRIRWAFRTLRWVTRITRWDPPAEFQDIQERGPYRTWIHTHRFTEDAGGVTMHDRVEYALPLGLLGRLVHAASVRRQLHHIFEYRRRAIDALYGSGSASLTT